MAVASEIGMAVSHLAKIERGMRDLNYQWMLRIARELSVHPADLLLPVDGALTARERKLIEAYRVADLHVIRAFDAMAESISAECERTEFSNVEFGNLED